MTATLLAITRLGQRGEGVGVGPAGVIYVPYAVPGDALLADVDGDSGHIIELTTASPDRVPPICPSFGICGGCAVQEWAPAPYAAWKRGLVFEALAKAGVRAEVAPLVDAHGEGRRRATVHARRQPSANILAKPGWRVGFMRARAHEVVDLDRCPVLAPGLRGALPAARRLAAIVAELEKPLDLVVTATDAGMDVDLRGLGALPELLLHRLVEAAGALDLARLANHGSTVVERRTPTLRMGKARVVPPSGAFLQATVQGEMALASLVTQGVGSAARVADLFCGLGTFALRLAATASVAAFDLEGPALAALAKAARGTPGLRPIATEGRDLFRRPLLAAELARFDAVVFDPPRAGASEQAEALAASAVPTIVAVSCNPATFARDAAILVGGGYALGSVVPVDQFRYAPHIEIVGVFRRAKARRPRSVFG